MKTILSRIIQVALLALFSVILMPAAFAAGLDPTSTLSADVTTAIPVDAQNMILGYFLKIAVAHSWFATLLAFVALSRVWAKPVSSVIHTIIDLTPSTRDNGILNAVLLWFTTDPLGQFCAYLIDWVTSIKIVPHNPTQPL